MVRLRRVNAWPYVQLALRTETVIVMVSCVEVQI